MPRRKTIVLIEKSEILAPRETHAEVASAARWQRGRKPRVHDAIGRRMIAKEFAQWNRARIDDDRFPVRKRLRVK